MADGDRTRATGNKPPAAPERPEDQAKRAAEFPSLEPELTERYSRQIRFAPIGPEGQRRLLESSVLIVGAGALGASLAQHMARAGVGRIRIVDRDFVERSNLQRQTLFDEEDARLALPKAAAAAAKLRRINSGIVIEEHVADVTAANAAALAAGVRLVLDGTDNAATRLVMSDACFVLGIPFLYGGAVGAEGMSALLVPGETACLRCLIGGEHEAAEAGTCETEGVISPIVELIAALQAAEALKFLSGRSEALRRTWVSASLWPFGFREWRLPGPNRNCPACGRARPKAKTAGFGPERGTAAAMAERTAVRIESVAAVAKRIDVRDESGSAVAEQIDVRNEAATVRPERVVRGKSESAVKERIAVRNEADGERANRSLFRDGPPAAGSVRAAVLCGRDTVQLTLDRPIPLERIEARLEENGCRITRNPWLIRAETEDGRRFVWFRGEGRVLVQGVRDADEAVRGLMELLNHPDLEGAAAK